MNKPRRFLLVAIAWLPIQLAGSGAGAQAALTDGSTRVSRYAQLSTTELDRLQRGEVIAKSIDARDRNEVALVGIVALAADRETIISRLMGSATNGGKVGRRVAGSFSAPPTADDLRDFSADPGDVAALRSCRAGSCNVKMPLAWMEQFQAAIDWPSARPETSATPIVRAKMLDYVVRYRRDGNDALIEYGDQKTPANVKTTFDALLDETPVFREEAPELFDFARRYPAETLASIRDCIYWSVDRIDGLRPVTTITHIAAFTPVAGTQSFIVSKQLYASHYFNGMLELGIVIADSSAASAPQSYYVVVRRMQFDNLPSSRLFNIRGRVIGKMRDALRAELEEQRSFFSTLATRSP